MHLVLQRDDGVYLESAILSPGYVDTGEPIHYRLDRKITEDECSSVTYDSATATTTFNLPYSIDTDSNYLVVMRGSTTPGRILRITASTATSITVQGDHSASAVFIGLTFESRFQFSEFSLKETDSTGSKVAVTHGRLQLQTLTLVYDDTGHFQVQVTPLYRDTSTFTFSGRILGDGSNLLDTLVIHSGEFAAPLMSKSDQVKIELVSESFLPFNFVSAEVAARFTSNMKGY